jgi:hypothetical protein
MGPLYAHISQDPYPGKLLKAKAPHVMKWIERMHFKHGTHCRRCHMSPHALTTRPHAEPSTECTTEYLPDDVVPPTLFPILQLMFDEHVPVLLDTLARLAEFRRGGGGGGDSDLKVAAAGRIPRSLGWHDFTVGGAKGRRLVYPYAVWMFQRPLDHYRSLTRYAVPKPERWRPLRKLMLALVVACLRTREEQRRIDARVLSQLRGGTDKWADALRVSGECRVARVNNQIVWDSPQPEPPQQQRTPAKL